MPVASVFTRDGGIYGKKDFPGFKTCVTSNFVVFKDEKKWTVGHAGSGFSVEALAKTANIRPLRKPLLEFIERLETARPDECALLAFIGTDGWPDDLRPIGQALVDWCVSVRS